MNFLKNYLTLDCALHAGAAALLTLLFGWRAPWEVATLASLIFVAREMEQSSSRWSFNWTPHRWAEATAGFPAAYLIALVFQLWR